jgi:hypothetical protein
VENAWIESFNGHRRDEVLNSRRFDSLLGVRVIIEDWRIDYNASTDPPATSPLRGSPGPRPSANSKLHSNWTTQRVPLTFALFDQASTSAFPHAAA